MRTQRNIARSIDVHGKELNRFFFGYVFECDQVSKNERKALFKKWNKQWLDYCFKHRKHKIIPPSPDGLKMLIRSTKRVNDVQRILGITVTKPNMVRSVLLFLKRIFHL